MMKNFTLPRWLVGLLALCFCVTLTHADSYQIATITITNAPTTNGQHLIWNGTRRNFTNTLGATTAILTNATTGGSATNLRNALTIYRESTIQFLSITNGTNLIIRGYPNAVFSITIGSNWGSYTLTTNQTTNSQFVQVPMSVFDVNVRTQMAAALVYDLGVYPSNALPANALIMTNFVGITNAQTLTQKALTSPNITGGTNTSAVITNATIQLAAAIGGTVTTLTDGTITNTTITKAAAIGGTVTALTDGSSTNQFGTNWQSLLVTNLVVSGKMYGTNGIFHTLTVTNLSAPGSGTASLKIGSAAVASGDYSTAIGDAASATNASTVAVGKSAAAGGDGSIAIGLDSRAYTAATTAIGTDSYAYDVGALAVGYGAVSGYTNSTALGVAATATAAYQVMLGTAAEHVSIPGELRDSKQTNVWFTGTNRFDLAVSFTASNLTTVANGVNLIDPGMKSTLRISGPTAAYSIDKITRGYNERFIRIRKNDPYTLTIANESGSGGGAAENRILTGTGANATVTNYTGTVELSYDETLGRWIMGFKSN